MRKMIKMKTSIRVRKSTKIRLGKFGTLGQSFDDVVTELIDHIEKCDIYWAEK
jgi:hypothetical protein